MKNSIYILFLLFCSSALAQTSDTDKIENLAKQMANPLSSVTNIPFQNHFGFNSGTYGGFQYILDIQPIVSFKISDNLNIMSRSIIPIISQKNIIAENSSQAGLGDILQSFYFTPAVIKSKFVWGVGPAISLPTATNDFLGTQKWAAGPTAILLFKDKNITFGTLINTLWSFAGSGSNDVNSTLFQPFVNYVAKKGRSYSIASENLQSWNNDIFGGDITLTVAQIIKVKKQLIQFGIGPQFYYGNNPYSPKWGIKFNMALIYPKHKK